MLSCIKKPWSNSRHIWRIQNIINCIILQCSSLKILFKTSLHSKWKKKSTDTRLDCNSEYLICILHVRIAQWQVRQEIYCRIWQYLSADKCNTLWIKQKLTELHAKKRKKICIYCSHEHSFYLLNCKTHQAAG